jgi:hypothetical protein
MERIKEKVEERLAPMPDTYLYPGMKGAVPLISRLEVGCVPLPPRTRATKTTCINVRVTTQGCNDDQQTRSRKIDVDRILLPTFNTAPTNQITAEACDNNSEPRQGVRRHVMLCSNRPTHDPMSLSEDR